MQKSFAAADQGREAPADFVGRSDQYSAVLYDNMKGLPTSEANDIVQTGEGFIWIGCYSGLIRYDGKDFERLDSASGIAGVVSLHVDSRDRLWIGTNDSGLALMEHGKIRKWGEKDGLPSAKICNIGEDSDGTIYAGTTSGVAMVTPDLNIRVIDDPRIADKYIDQIVRGENGLFYCMSNEGDVFTLRNGIVAEYTDHGDIGLQGITCILPDDHKDGMLYIGAEGSVLYHGSADLDPAKATAIDISPLFNVLNLQRIGDRIWVLANNGIGVLDEDGFCPLTDLPMNNSVGRVMTDYEGNLWFTSFHQGVMKLVYNQFSDVFAHFGMSGQVVNSTCVYNGCLFVGTDTGLAVLDENGPLSSFPLTAVKTPTGVRQENGDLIELLQDNRIRSIIRDSRDRLWISTWRGCGLLRYDRGEVTVFTEADGLLSDRIRAVCETSDGRILVAVTGGVCVIEGDRVTASYGKENGIVNPESLSVAAAPNGDILLGSNGGGIYVISGEGTSCLGTDDGLASTTVMRIKYDAKRDIFWLVTSNSIAYMDPDYQITTIENFPYSNNFDLFENSRGDMWILSSNGIYVVPAEELLAGDQIRPAYYGMEDGLPSLPTGNAYNELTPEGELYIAGNTGTAKVNIESFHENVSDLKMTVPYIDADGILYFPDESGFRLPSDTRKLTVYAYIFNYSLTDPKVSYKLEGFDLINTTVSRSELDPITYTNLPGGSYRFVMELRDDIGQEGKTLSVPIFKEKTLIEKSWFFSLLNLIAVLFITACMLMYNGRKTRAMEKKHREEAERERINNELSMAKRIQESQLPHEFPAFPERREFDLCASMDPAKEVGGDFYDFFLIDDDHLCLVIADVSGKGIPAALLMMVSKVVLKNYAMLGISPAEMLGRTNGALCANGHIGMFVTVWLGILEISTGKITAVNAGHEYPAIEHDGRFTLLRDKHGLVLGGMEDTIYKEYEIMLEPGDKLFLYTDGVPEATAAGNVMFGTDRMLDALNTDPEAKPYMILHNVREAANEFTKDMEQFDDMTMLCLDYKGPVTSGESRD